VDLDNLESAGVLGLVEAAGKFDPTRNAQFKSFAYLRVRGAILDEMRRNSPLPQHMMERITAIRKAQRTLPAPVTVDALVAATGLSVEDVTDALAAERFGRMVSWEQTALPGGLRPAESAPPPDEEASRDEDVNQLTAAIESLGPQERRAVTLYYREDLRLREIADLMNLSVSRISRILTKALFELGELMKAARAEPAEGPPVADE
jgi:RNA polymerase sigma factor for flagellar operon FliA